MQIRSDGSCNTICRTVPSGYFTVMSFASYASVESIHLTFEAFFVPPTYAKDACQ